MKNTSYTATVKKLLLVGLGNPGEKFEHTRHNLGIWVVRDWYTASIQYAKSVTDWHDNIQLEAKVAEVVIGDTKVVCVFPLTFMNDSGKAVAAVANKYAVAPQNIVVVHDDLELPFGGIQWVDGGSAKGHKGVQSVYELLNTQDIKRLRLGIGRPPERMDPSDFVLAKFSLEEDQQLTTTTILQAVEELSRRIEEAG